MRYGAVFPHADIGTDPAAIRGFVQAVEAAGFDYLIAYDHVTGAHPDRFAGTSIPGFANPPYVHDSPFHEVLTLFAYLAGVTSRLELVTSVLVLPQRQTALVAKQAAEVDMLSGGRLRLVVGVGWNFAEYGSLGVDFSSRGQHLEEQIVVLRKLWSEPLVSFQGRWHALDRVALAPRPTRQLPVWIGGGGSDGLLGRVGRHASGWMPLLPPSENAAAAVARLRARLAEAGRDAKDFGIDARIRAGDGKPAAWIADATRWRDLGATHLCLNAAVRGAPADKQLETAIRMKRAIGEALG
jgi:probable F420-dependent oxidoreductase